MAIVQAGSIKLFTKQTGLGDSSILFMSGVGQPHGFWNSVTDNLEENYKCITFDNRGIGKSDAPVGPYTIELLRDDILNLANSLKLDSFTLVGHSLGALVCLEFAMQYPDRVDALVFSSGLYPGPEFARWSPRAGAALFNPVGDFETRFLNGIRISTADGFMDREPDKVESLRKLRLAANQSLPAFGWQAASGFGYLTRDQTRSFNKPFLILYGDGDEVAVPENGSMLHKKFEQSELEIVEDAGHLLPFEKPEWFASRIDKFIRSSAGVPG